MKPDQIVSQNPEILGGALVFTGTRVPVDSLLAYLKAGDTLDDFLEGFPSVTREQAEAFLDLALTAPVGGARVPVVRQETRTSDPSVPSLRASVSPW